MTQGSIEGETARYAAAYACLDIPLGGWSGNAQNVSLLECITTDSSRCDLHQIVLCHAMPCINSTPCHAVDGHQIFLDASYNDSSTVSTQEYIQESI